MPTEVAVIERKRKYKWPEMQLNVWIIIMLTAASFETGAFAQFMQQQSVMKLGVPWYVYPKSTHSCSCSNVRKDNALHCHHGRDQHSLLHRHAVVDQRSFVTAWRRDNRHIYTLRVVAHRARGRRYTALQRRR
jgi:hypothetical protein